MRARRCGRVAATGGASAERPRPPKYGPNVIAALMFCWAVLGMPAGKRLAPILAELVPTCCAASASWTSTTTPRRCWCGMSAATIDRRLAPERSKHQLKGRSHTKPGSLLKSQIPIRTWARLGRRGARGSWRSTWSATRAATPPVSTAYTLTVTDIATGWTENRSVRNKARKWVLAALDEIAAIMPFPILGIDSDNGSEFINHHLLAWCEKRKITFTRSRPGNSNDGCHVEQKNWAIVRTVVGYHRYDTDGRTVAAQPDLGAAVAADQLLLPAAEARLQGPRRREGDQEVRHRHHSAPTRRTPRRPSPTRTRRSSPTPTPAINPAAVQRQIQALTAELLTITTSKAGPAKKRHPPRGHPSDESTNQTSRAS